MFADIISDLSIQTNNIYLAVERQLTTVNWKIKPDEEDQEQEQEATDHAHEEENEEKGGGGGGGGAVGPDHEERRNT